MVWEGRTKFIGDWVECKLAVAASADEQYSWVGQLMMRPDEWRDFSSRMGLKEVSAALWRSGE